MLSGCWRKFPCSVTESLIPFFFNKKANSGRADFRQTVGNVCLVLFLLVVFKLQSHHYPLAFKKGSPADQERLHVISFSPPQPFFFCILQQVELNNRKPLDLHGQDPSYKCFLGSLVSPAISFYCFFVFRQMVASCSLKACWFAPDTPGFKPNGQVLLSQRAGGRG